MRSARTKHNKHTPALAVVGAANCLHEADNAMPKLSVADLRERFYQLQSVGFCEKNGDVGGAGAFAPFAE